MEQVSGGANPQSIDFMTVFRNLPACHVLLSSDFTVLAATAAYYKSTHTTPEKLVGHNLFDIFPENKDTVVMPEGKNLSDSLHKVLRTKQTDEMPLQRYDLKVPNSKGGFKFIERWWHLVNTPVLNHQKEIIYLINTIEDVTHMMDAFEGAEDTFRRTRQVAAPSKQVTKDN